MSDDERSFSDSNYNSEDEYLPTKKTKKTTIKSKKSAITIDDYNDDDNDVDDNEVLDDDNDDDDNDDNDDNGDDDGDDVDVDDVDDDLDDVDDVDDDDDDDDDDDIGMNDDEEYIAADTKKRTGKKKSQATKQPNAATAKQDNYGMDGMDSNYNTDEDYNMDDDDDDDDDDDYDENYLQKFDSETKKNYIEEFHPECREENYNEIMALSKVVRDENNMIIDPLHRTIPFLTKYERARVLGMRAKQIEYGSLPFVEIPDNLFDPHIIANMELEKKKMPFIIRRPLPNGAFEYWNLKDLECISY